MSQADLVYDTLQCCTVHLYSAVQIISRVKFKLGTMMFRRLRLSVPRYLSRLLHASRECRR